MHVQSFNSAWQCSRATHKGKDNGLQNCLWYNQLCQLEQQWCWFRCCCCFPPFDSSVFPFIPLFPSLIAISLSSSLSLCSEPSTVTMDLSKRCLKARGSERQSLCVRDCVCEREAEREKVVLYSKENSHLSSEWCCIKEEAGKQAGYDTHGLDLNPHEKAGPG